MAISIIRTYKFRLYPNSVQQQKLHDNLTVCRWLYNKMIKNIETSGFQSRDDLNYFLTELKQQEPWLHHYHSKMLQMVSTQIASAQKSLITLRKKGHPTGNLALLQDVDYFTIVYNQSGFDIIKHGNVDLLYLSKIGFMEMRIHRHIPETVMIKQVTILKSKTGKWYACITCNVDIVPPKINLKNAIGIDVGIRNFAYDSDGFTTPNPLNLQKMLKPLARAQRKISRRQKGSNNYKNALRFYQIIHERIKNRRKDFLHKLSSRYAKKYDVVFVERLKTLNMIKNHRLARKIMDSGWRTFDKMIAYKSMLVEVPARNTTVDCSRCGFSVPKSLAIHTHRCHVCGLVIDRDYNAAINILKKGLSIFKYDLPQELREVTPVEISMRSRNQEKATGSFVDVHRFTISFYAS